MKMDKIEIYNIKHIGERIKEIRKKRLALYDKDNVKYEKYYCCKTQDDFADALEISRKSIINWEQGYKIPPLDKLIKICQLLDCNINYFLGGNDTPYISTVAYASHYTKIDPDIISYALNNADYLDFLNFFMHPDNCKKLLEEITLTGWSQYWGQETLSKIQKPLLNTIQKAFSSFYISTPMQNISVESFAEHLSKCFTHNNIYLSDCKKGKSNTSIKSCLSEDLYFDIYSQCPKEWSEDEKLKFFTNYIANLLFVPLQNSIYVELHKKKISDEFLSLLDKYIESFN